MKITLKSSIRLYDIIYIIQVFYCKKVLNYLFNFTPKAEKGCLKLDQCQVKSGAKKNGTHSKIGH